MWSEDAEKVFEAHGDRLVILEEFSPLSVHELFDIFFSNKGIPEGVVIKC